MHENITLKEDELNRELNVRMQCSKVFDGLVCVEISCYNSAEIPDLLDTFCVCNKDSQLFANFVVECATWR